MSNKERVMRLSNVKDFCTLQAKDGSLAMSLYAALFPHLEFLQIMQSILTEIQHKKSLLHWQT